MLFGHQTPPEPSWVLPVLQAGTDPCKDSQIVGYYLWNNKDVGAAQPGGSCPALGSQLAQGELEAPGQPTELWMEKPQGLNFLILEHHNTSTS